MVIEVIRILTSLRDKPLNAQVFIPILIHYDIWTDGEWL